MPGTAYCLVNARISSVVICVSAWPRILPTSLRPRFALSERTSRNAFSNNSYRFVLIHPACKGCGIGPR